MRTTEEADQLNNFFKILAAFDIKIKQELKEDENLVLHDDENCKSDNSLNPTQFLEIPENKNEGGSNFQLMTQSCNDSDIHYSARTSINPFGSIEGKA